MAANQPISAYDPLLQGSETPNPSPTLVLYRTIDVPKVRIVNAVRVRREPSTSGGESTVIRIAQVGEELDVHAGIEPVQADGYTWIPVTIDGQEGWVAQEGFVERFSDQVQISVNAEEVEPTYASPLESEAEANTGLNEVKTTVDYIAINGEQTVFYGHTFSQAELADLKNERNDQTLTEAMSFTLSDGTPILLTTNIPDYHFDGVDLRQFEQDLQTLGYTAPDGKTVVIEFRDIALKDSEEHGQHFQGINISGEGETIYFMRGEDFETERRYRVYIRPDWLLYYVNSSAEDDRVRIAEGYEDSETTTEIYALLLSDQMQNSPSENIMDIVARRIKPSHLQTRDPRFRYRTVAITYDPTVVSS